MLLGAAIVGLGVWLASRDIKFPWYAWLIGIIGVLLLMFSIQNYFGSIAEDESAAATKHLLFEGIPALILIASMYAFYVWGKRSEA